MNKLICKFLIIKVLAVVLLCVLTATTAPKTIWAEAVPEYDPAAVAFIEDFKKKYINPELPFVWAESDYSKWRGLIWSDDRPRRLKGINLSSEGLGPRQGSVFKYNTQVDISHLLDLEEVFLDFKIGPHYPVRVHDLPKLKTLKVVKGIGGQAFTMSDLPTLPSLEKLDLSLYMGYTTEDLKYIGSLKRLRHLRLNRIVKNIGDTEKLTDLSFLSDLKQLESLEVARNSLERMEGLGGLSSLTNLNVSQNRLTSLDILDDLNLTSLDLSRNGIENLDGLETQARLKHLCLEYNKIKYLDKLTALKNMESLSVSFNSLDGGQLYALQALPSLKKLSITAPTDTLEALNALTNLEELNITVFNRDRENTVELADFSSVTELKRLKRLYISGPFQKAIPITGLENFLSLDYLKLDHFDAEATRGLGDLQGLTQLVAHNSKFNARLTGLERLSSLARLELSGVNLEDTNWLESFKSLEYLDLKGFQLELIPWTKLPASLKYIDLGNNNMLRGEVDISGLPNLNVLKLNDTGITDFSGLTQGLNLRELDLSNTAVDDLNLFKCLPKLEKLNLRNCFLSGAIEFGNEWPRLKELNLFENRISSISGWENLPEGTVVDIGYNRLSLNFLYQVYEASRFNALQWRMGLDYGSGSRFILASQWDVYEPVELKVGQIYDLSAVVEMGGKKTSFSVSEVLDYDATEKRPRYSTRSVERIDPGYKPHPSRKIIFAYTMEGGRFAFTRPGCYVIYMSNPMLSYETGVLISRYPTGVRTSIITVKELE